jgi:hypothetical protein
MRDSGMTGSLLFTGDNRSTHQARQRGRAGCFRCLSAPSQAYGLEVLLDVGEDIPDSGTEQDENSNDHDGHQRDDQRVLYEALATFTAEETIQHA